MKKLSTTGNSTKIYKYSYGLLFLLLLFFQETTVWGQFHNFNIIMSNVYLLAKPDFNVEDYMNKV